MDTRFPPLISQTQINAGLQARVLVRPDLPSLPYGEWLVAGVALLFLLSL